MSAATTSELTLFGTSACHLCEQALDLIQPWLQRGWVVQQVDISESDELFDRYGLLIPVLRFSDSATDRELNWPFSAADVAALIGD